MSKLISGICAEIKRCKNIKILILDIAIIVAVLFLARGIFAVADLVSYELNAGIPVTNLAYTVEREEYAKLTRMCHEDGIKREKGEDYQEFYALADYYEAASMYKAYQEAGDTKHAAVQKEKMDAAAQKLGRLSATKSRVDTQLGL